MVRCHFCSYGLNTYCMGNFCSFGMSTINPLLFMQPCQHEALDSFMWMQLFPTQLLGKRKQFFMATQIQLQPLQRRVMHILHLFVLKQRVFLLSFHLSLRITGLIHTVTYSFILVFSWNIKHRPYSLALLAPRCSIVAWIMELFHMREFTCRRLLPQSVHMTLHSFAW